MMIVSGIVINIKKYYSKIFLYQIFTSYELISALTMEKINQVISHSIL